ncbi:MAG: ATP-binding protein [Bdellovibrionales bacterium]
MNPALFETIKGHDEIKKNLISSIESQRLAHSLLFTGPSGVGKKMMAFAVAQKLLCETHSACGKCPACVNVQKNQSEYLLFISTEALNLKLEDVQGIHPFLAFSTDKFKIVIIDEAEKLNIKASNSLLKIIEEPPPQSFFFFISSEAYKLPVTIRSRLQVLRFYPIPLEILKQLVVAEAWMLAASQGSLDQLQEIQDQKEIRSVAIEAWTMIFKKGVQAPALVFPLVLKKRKEALMVCKYWLQFLRDARLLQVGETSRGIHKDQQDLISKITLLSFQELDFLIQKTLELEKNLRSHIDCILCFENFVIDLQSRIQSWNSCG